LLCGVFGVFFFNFTIFIIFPSFLPPLNWFHYFIIVCGFLVFKEIYLVSFLAFVMTIGRDQKGWIKLC
jgi:hypothetical protein